MSLRKAFWRRYREIRRRVLGVPATGGVDFGQLRRVQPFGRHFGEDRGRALDRYYIEGFLAAHAADIKGRVLEIGENRYTRQFGGDRVTRCDVLHVSPGNPRATIVADLTDAPQVPDATFDTAIITQTLHLIYDVGSAIRTIHRVLKPGGVLLLTVPGITQIPHGTTWASTWFWSFTPLAVTRALAESFGSGGLTVQSHGNVLSAAAMLYGLSSDDLTPDELDMTDPDYPVIIGARAMRGHT